MIEIAPMDNIVSTFIKPDWPAPANIIAYTTSRKGGISLTPYDSFNLAAHVDDKIKTVKANRHQLSESLKLRNEPYWINQVHGNEVVCVNQSLGSTPTADASYTTQPMQPCAVLTADCLPILLCDRHGRWISAVHAGWKGLLVGVISQAIKSTNVPKEDILAWLGPAIGQTAAEIDDDLLNQFIELNPKYRACFRMTIEKKWLANIYNIARLELQANGIQHIYGGKYCTHSDPERFYSYRRDNSVTGRMASLIWLADHASNY